MYRYKLLVEYNGFKYNGWQKQENLPTIQLALEQAVTSVTQEECTIYACGRTDKGVHALGQVCHFDTNKNLAGTQMQNALNFYLHNEQIAVYNVENLGINSDFHARFSCKERSYIYKITNRNYPVKLEENLSLLINKPLNVINMATAAKLLIGTHDFSTFRAVGCQAKSPIKTISTIEIKEYQNSFSNIQIYVAAKSFLYHQVRNIVGSLLCVGLGRWSIKEFEENFAKKDRKYGGPTAKAHGLYFLQAKY